MLMAITMGIVIGTIAIMLTIQAIESKNVDDKIGAIITWVLVPIGIVCGYFAFR